MQRTTAALVVAAGRGTRLADSGEAKPKQYRLLAGIPVLAHTLNALGRHPDISYLLTVIHQDDLEYYQDAVSQLPALVSAKLCPSVFGGATRQESVFNGLSALGPQGVEDVLIHDAARPFVSKRMLDELLNKMNSKDKGVLAAIPVTDTLKREDASTDRLETIARRDLWAAQTPQGFSLVRILAAHTKAAAEGIHEFTDDTSIAEWDGMTITISEGSTNNFKITTAADLERAEQLAKSLSMTDTSNDQLPLSQLTDIRMGVGYDVHAFDDGEAVMLGGVSIPHTKKLKGHSDADVVLHAITDATLGAIGDGDIGQHFPPSDAQWKGAASDQFQIDAIRRVSDLKGRIAHIDVTIVCEEPKIGPHREKIRSSIAAICSLPDSRVSVKATTSEKLGFTGRKEGIATLASVTVRLPMQDDE
ncbi:MAG: bifunctional 2-C-methyl-D-erythritol 4-phosphate cytidylyltransferase/2-C-methyl-D-erythritol 2,4-cyclodiphosphate synthase [Roseibium sp.]